jgi:hypothetical protein
MPSAYESRDGKGLSTSDTSPLKLADLEFFQRVVHGVNKSDILNFKLKEKHVIQTSATLKDYQYYDVTLITSEPTDWHFFTGEGPFWSALRSLELMQNAWSHKISDKDIALMFGLAHAGVNVDNVIIRQYEKRVKLDQLYTKLNGLAAQNNLE